MNLADVFTVFFIIVGFVIVYVGYWLLAAGLFPTMVERCAEQVGRAPVKTTLLGLVTFGPLLAIGFGISSKAPNAAGKAFGIGIVLVASLAALFGSAGLALRIGTGLKSSRDERDPWRRMLRGGIVLGLTFVLPFLGTFLVMPLAFVSGFGAFLIGVWNRRLVQVRETLPAPVPPAVPSTPS